MITHLPYFDALGSMEDETDPEWRPTLAGLVVLRLVDDWLKLGAQVVTTDVTGLRAVHQAIADIPDGNPTKSILRGVVTNLEEAETAELRLVGPQLMAYGMVLVYASQWTLAIDVFETVLERTTGIEPDINLAMDAAAQIGSINISTGNWDAAETAYKEVEELAFHAKDLSQQLIARIGFAKLKQARGDLPTAEAMFDQVADEASRNQAWDVFARALHNKATVASKRGQHDKAIRFAYDALRLTTSLRERDRLLGDIAASFVELGSWQVARDGFLILAVTAQEQFVKWSATVNLLELAVFENQREVFDQYRLQLEHVTLPPILQMAYYLYTGKGYQRFGFIDAARHYMERALATATKHRLNQFRFEIEQLLENLESAEVTAHSIQSHPVPSTIAHIAEAINDMRQLTYAAL